MPHYFLLIALIWIPRFYLRFQPAAEGENGLAPTDESLSRYNITSREGEIIELIITGCSNREIADTLYISPSTVRNHIYSIYQKLNINSRLQLVSRILIEKGGNGASQPDG